MSAGMHWWAIPRMGPALSFADAGILCHWTFPRIEISAVAVWLEVSVALCGEASSDGMKIGRATGGVSAVGKPGTANQFQRRELVAVPVLRHTHESGIFERVALWGGSSCDEMKIGRATGGVSAVGKVSLDEGLSGRVTRESKAPEVEVGAKQ